MKHLIAAITMLTFVPAWCAGAAAQPARVVEHRIPVEIQTVRERLIRGQLQHLSLADGAQVLSPGDRTPLSIPTADIVRIRFSDAQNRASNDGFRLLLTNGDRVRGMISDGNDEKLFVQNQVFGRVPVPIGFIQVLEAPNAKKSGFRQSLQWLTAGHTADTDRVLLTNGDVVHGFVDTIAPDRLVVESEHGLSTLEFRLVVAIRLLPSPHVPRPGPSARLFLYDAGEVTVDALRLGDDQIVRAEPVFGGEVAVDVGAIDRIVFSGGRWVWLDDLAVAATEHVPMLSVAWPHKINRNVRGGTLTVAGKSFERGIGVHSRTRLTYDLDKQYRRFVTSFGVDDDSGPYADVTIRILVEGVVRMEQTNIGFGKLHGPVRIEVAGAQTLELFVDFGDNAGIQDRFDWIEPALIR